MSSKYLPFVSAAVILADYYLGWDIVSIWYVCLCGLGVMITCKDVSPIFPLFLLMCVMVSSKNTPSINWDSPADYYTRPYILAQMIIAISLLVCGALERITESIIYKRFKPTPVLYGLCAFVAALLLNGIFSEYYTVMNLVYAIFLAMLFLGIFCFTCGNIKVSGETFERIAYSFIAMFIVLATELTVVYITYDNLIVDGVINRGEIRFGWGTYNNFGLYAIMCLPANFYLAAKYRHGWIFTLAGAVNLFMIFMCMSRQVMVMGTLIYALCMIWLLIRTKGYARLINALIFGVLALAFLIAFAAAHEWFFKLFSNLANSLETGSGRTLIWKDGVEKFLNYPLFGAGFYSRRQWVWGQSGFADILPIMYHNTVVQVMACSGIVGLAAYAVHRVQTVVSFLKDVTHDRIFVALIIVGMLLSSLLDNHLFYLFPTLIYSMLIGVLTLSERKKEAALAVRGDKSEIKDAAV